MSKIEWISFIFGMVFFGGCGILAAMTTIGIAARTIN